MDELSQKLATILQKSLISNNDNLANLISSIILSDSPTMQMNIPNMFQQALKILSHEPIVTKDALISFGSNNSTGDITITDVAKGNIIKLNMNFFVEDKVSIVREVKIPANTSHLWRLITLNQRRLEKLEEQSTFFGSLCPPHISMEIEDVKEKLKELHQEMNR